MSKQWHDLSVNQKVDQLHDDFLKAARIIEGLSDHRSELQAEIGHLRTELTHLKARIASWSKEKVSEPRSEGEQCRWRVV
jgi:uncharacterized coiled-coil DUF342 family protein